MPRTGFSHTIFCFVSATIALTACCSKVIYSLFRIFTHQLVVVWISASSGSVRFFIWASTIFWTSSRSMDLMAASASLLAKDTTASATAFLISSRFMVIHLLKSAVHNLSRPWPRLWPGHPGHWPGFLHH